MTELKSTKLPMLDLPDLEESLAKFPKESCALHGVGFLHYDPPTRTAFLFIESSREWVVTQPVERAVILQRAKLMVDHAHAMQIQSAESIKH